MGASSARSADQPSTLDELRAVAGNVRQRFDRQRRVLSFDAYLQLFAETPIYQSRDAARYVRDMIDHFGQVEVERPWGRLTRYRVFDQTFLEQGASSPGDAPSRREALVGQEHVQAELYRVLSNFCREGRPSRLMLLHGPNGSAKSTVARCLMAGLEYYSTLDEGALYRFHWVFPSKSTTRGTIGFGGRASSGEDGSYAHLPDEELDARLFMEVRDHPLFLVPLEDRRRLLERLYEEGGVVDGPPDWLLHGTLSHKSRQVFDALLASYGGDLAEVLRHVQVERYFISRRYRCGVVTIGPQLSVDASERQVTSDRSLGALPPSLQSLSLFEAYGELVDAHGGLLEFSDLLKRPLDTFKYLQQTVETGEVSLKTQTLLLNCVFLASCNEVHLAAFREHSEFQSFRGRLELVRAPYLLHYPDEKRIYDHQIVPQLGRPAAPHATELAARFAVLTRLRKPTADHYEAPVRQLVAELSALEKLELYGSGATPSRLDQDSAKLLRSTIAALYEEGQSYPIYEGSVGASPREMRGVLLDAAQSPHYSCLSPFAVLAELDRLCKRTGEYAWLEEERRPGGYHDHALFLEALRRRFLDDTEDEFRRASGLVDEVRYAELFDRYITHVSFWVKGEKLRNPITGAYEDADERMMSEVEALMGVSGDVEGLRHALIGKVAAWAIDHPGGPIDNAIVFRDQLDRLRDAAFEDRRLAVARMTQAALSLVRDGGEGLDGAQRVAARSLLDGLRERFGYDDESAADAAAALLRERYVELVG